MSMPAKEKAAPARTALVSKHIKLSKLNQKSQTNIDKSGLMSPPAVLDMLGIRYQRSDVRLSVYCPFHKGGKERNPSLMMDVKDGHYRCFTCGEKGGDVIAFYRAVTGAGFVEALEVLGVHNA